ncbi:hypothetical protein WJ62_02985 [Burkholderia diffusa]|nr:hypothetical protein WJ62_02985 [Burkholderia diffusa]
MVSSLIGKLDVPPDLGEAESAFNATQNGGGGASSGRGFGSDQLPQFQADGQMNAVIVRDYAWRMNSYAKLIAALDIMAKQVEIEAQIIDVRVDSLEQLGVDWHLTSRNINANFDGRASSSSTGSTNGGGGVSPGSGLATGMVPGATLTTILGNAGRTLLTSVNALEQKGDASIVSRPKVLTQDNVQATLEDNQTFYVPVAGAFGSSLFSVQAGTSLRVTPLTIVDATGKSRIRLSVHIEDGGISGTSTVSSLPVVNTRRIDTEAMVGEGDSLLIGGLIYSEDMSLNSGIPVLSKIPVIGALFQQRNSNRVRVERLFLITPRLVRE